MHRERGCGGGTMRGVSEAFNDRAAGGASDDPR
jgi:hypothetical protein